MIQGVLQRLQILEQSEGKLVLRELPLLDWLIAGAVLLFAIAAAVGALWLTALVAFVVAMLFVLMARTRIIVFSAEDNMLRVRYQSPLRSSTVLQMGLHELSRAYLSEDDDSCTQVMLVTVMGDEWGLSVYSRDLRPWKDDIVLAINAVLHQEHKRVPDPDAVI
jgi:pheromone shutdown protein TraB